MYIFPSFVDQAAANAKVEWPSSMHRDVAINLGTCNPRVTKMDQLMEIVQTVCKIPIERIDSITVRQLVDEYNMEHIL